MTSPLEDDDPRSPPPARARAAGTRARGRRPAGGGGARGGAAAPRGRDLAGAGSYHPREGAQERAGAARGAARAGERGRARRARRHRAPAGCGGRRRAAPLGARRYRRRRRGARFSRSTRSRIPGNVGTILRSALGLGAAGVVALKGTAELTSPKVVRGSMGALFRLPAVTEDSERFLDWARERGVELWVAEADGEPLGAGRRPALGPAGGAGARERGRGRGPGAAGRGEAPGRDPARAGRGVAQRGDRRGHPASRGRACGVTGLPQWVLVAWFALLGAALGSFLNVCILRWGAEPKQSVMHPPSRCPHCGHAIRWYENIPILSWIFLRGRCSGCGAPISPMYPAIEATAALLWGGAVASLGPSLAALELAVGVHPPARHRRERRPGLHHPARVLPRRHRDRARVRGLARAGGAGGRRPGRALRRGAGAAGRRAERAGAGPGGDGRRRLRADGHGRRVLRLGGGVAGARARRLRRASVSCRSSRRSLPPPHQPAPSRAPGTRSRQRRSRADVPPAWPCCGGAGCSSSSLAGSCWAA